VLQLYDTHLKTALSFGDVINCTVAKGQLQITGFRDKQSKSEDNKKNLKALSERLAKKKDKR